MRAAFAGLRNPRKPSSIHATERLRLEREFFVSLALENSGGWSRS
jgi:hypothetical protein